MLFLLSPAKSLDFETASPAALLKLASQPPFIPQSTALIELLRAKSAAEIGDLMDLSEALSALNAERYAAWSPQFTRDNSKPALLAFNGDVYEGLDAASLTLAQARWAYEHLAILSGLYGVLRPFDLMQPYRLEMGTRLKNERGGNLYAFWGDTLAEHLNQRAAQQRVPVIVNLASQEYFRAANRACLTPRVIECVFEDWKSGQYKIISFFAKRARGLMARYAVTEGIDRPEGLRDFKQEGYAFQAELSTPERLLFRRRLA